MKLGRVELDAIHDSLVGRITRKASAADKLMLELKRVGLVFEDEDYAELRLHRLGLRGQTRWLATDARRRTLIELLDAASNEES